MLTIKEYERQQALIELCSKLAEAEKEISNGDRGEDFMTFARKLREKIHGKA